MDNHGVTRVGFLGLGRMGLPMAGRLFDAGYQLRVWNRTPGPADKLALRGATAARTAAEAARDADVVITMLADPRALDDVVFGNDGVASSIDPEAVLIDMSTVGPTTARRAAERLRPVHVLDAPVLGSVPQAEVGSLVILVGGDEEVLDRCSDVLEPMGRVMYVGPTGAGATVKLANNAAGMSALVALGEVLSLTDVAGLDPEVVLDAVAMGPLASFVDRWRDGLTSPAGRVDFRLLLARKDLALALDESRELGLHLELLRTAIARYDGAIAAGLGDEDITAVVRYLRAQERAE
jgi:3-hydroxyisobutyrate dehydrogenase/2-hydroxy-3-oxopropionate reductase